MWALRGFEAPSGYANHAASELSLEAGGERGAIPPEISASPV